MQGVFVLSADEDDSSGRRSMCCRIYSRDAYRTHDQHVRSTWTLTDFAFSYPLKIRTSRPASAGFSTTKHGRVVNNASKFIVSVGYAISLAHSIFAAGRARETSQ